MLTFLNFLHSLKTSEIALGILYLIVVPILVFPSVEIISKRFTHGKKLKAILFAVFSLIYTVLGLFLNRFTGNLLFHILFRDIVLTVSSIAAAISVFTLSSVGRILKITTFVSLTFLLALEVLLIFTLNLKTVEIFIHLRRFLIVLALFPIAWALVELVPYNRLKKPLKFFTVLLTVAVGILWEFGIVEFNISAFIGLTFIITSTLGYIWFSGLFENILLKKLSELFNNEEDTQAVVNYINKLLFLLLIYIYYLSAVKFLNLQEIFVYLKNLTLINTDVVNISVYNLLVATYSFLIFYYSIGVLKKVVKLLFPPGEREDKGGSLEAVVYNLGILIAVIVFLSSMGLSWRVLLPIAGALGIGLGFGLQTILNNYISGFILMFSRVIKVGDFIEIPGNAGRFINNKNDTIFGRVENISVLTTQVRTLDGIDILVPNSTFIGNQVINYSLRNPYVRVRFPFGVSYSSDPRQVKEILLKLAYDCPWAKNFYKPPQVWFTEMGDSALIFELMFWVDIRDIWRNTYAAVSYSLVDWVYTNGWYRLKEANIEIPFPQQDIWFRNKLKVVFESEGGKPIKVEDLPEPPKGEG